MQGDLRIRPSVKILGASFAVLLVVVRTVWLVHFLRVSGLGRDLLGGPDIRQGLLSLGMQRWC